MNTTSRNSLTGRWIFGCFIAGVLMLTTATSLPAQSAQPVQPPQKRLPFIMVMRQGSTTAWTVPDMMSNAYTGTNGTNLVIEHIDITYNGGINTAVHVEMDSCVSANWYLSFPVPVSGCYSMEFQTGLVDDTYRVTASFPVTMNVPTRAAEAQTNPGILKFLFGQFPGNSWSTSVPPGVIVTVAGHYEPL